MASFRSHVSLGIATGILGIMALSSWFVTGDLFLASSLFVAIVLGSILPDIDSDSGIPFHIAFGSFSLVGAVLAGVRVYHDNPGDIMEILGWSGGVFFGIYGILGWCFKRFTRHRGMAHSLPAALLAGLVTFFLTVHFSFEDEAAFLLALALMTGYVGHLILDELYAATNFHGRPFIPNQALGSALKLTSQNSLINAAVYGAILFLVAGNVGRFSLLLEQLWQTVQ
jgi:membrane-bound metal-dependent hydrolase YbcI (DUF457 family)